MRKMHGMELTAAQHVRIQNYVPVQPGSVRHQDQEHMKGNGTSHRGLVLFLQLRLASVK